MAFQKIILVLLFLFGGLITTFGQTYYYKNICVVNTQTGVRTQHDWYSTYITFTEDGCYRSDANGYSIDKCFYKYRGKQKNMHIYQQSENVRQITMYGIAETGKTTWGALRFIFSSDYTRANWERGAPFENKVEVFERANPEDVEVPDNFY